MIDISDVSAFWLNEINLVWGIEISMGIFWRKESYSLQHECWQDETSITNEAISEETVCGEIERPNKDKKFPEVAKKVPCLCHTDKEQSNEGITEIEQTGKIYIWLFSRTGHF